jgi:hypothetical protein
LAAEHPSGFRVIVGNLNLIETQTIRSKKMFHEKALGRTLSGTGNAIDFSGTWENELQSIMTLAQVDSTLSGKYTSTVSGGGTPTVGDLLGYVDGDLISVVVHWRDFQAITAWVGQLNPKATTQTIDSLWQMTNQVAAGDEWASINAGADYFIRK